MSVEVPALLIMAMIMVESGGERFAVGDGGRSVGCLQISAAVVEDVNRIIFESGDQLPGFSLDDRTRIGPSIAMLEIYLGHYASPAILGREPNATDFLRIWNGGPDGYLQIAETDPYVRKVSIEYARLMQRAFIPPRVDVPGETPTVHFQHSRTP